MVGKDTYRHQGLRKKLIDGLRLRKVADPRVLDAMELIPRHLFIDDSAFVEKAYDDIAFPIGNGQTISQPYTVAVQTSLLNARKGMKVLEVGTGSGYQCALLVQLGLKVFSIERHRPLYVRSRALLKDLGLKAQLYYGDGYKGLPAYAPFDRIMITCGAPNIPDGLLQQLAPGGRCVVPVGEGGVQRMLTLDKLPDGGFAQEEHGLFRFVPMLEHRTG